MHRTEVARWLVLESIAALGQDVVELRLGELTQKFFTLGVTLGSLFALSSCTFGAFQRFDVLLQLRVVVPLDTASVGQEDIKIYESDAASSPLDLTTRIVSISE